MGGIGAEVRSYKMRTCFEVSPWGCELMTRREGEDLTRKVEMRWISVGLGKTGQKKKEEKKPQPLGYFVSVCLCVCLR